jgi:hypothetical protein
MAAHKIGTPQVYCPHCRLLTPKENPRCVHCWRPRPQVAAKRVYPDLAMRGGGYERP